MNNDKVKELLERSNKDISNNDTENLKNALENADEEKYEKVSAVKIKKLSLTTVLSSVLGLFGAGDFYLGNFKRGVIKLLCSLVLPLVLIFTFCLWAVPEYDFYKKVNVTYYAIHSNRVVVSEDLLSSDIRNVTVAEVLGEEAPNGSSTYNYSFSNFEDTYNGTNGVITQFSDFNSKVSALNEIKTTITYTKAETDVLKEQVAEVKAELAGETIPEAILAYETALTDYQTKYFDYETLIAAYETKLETFTDADELKPLTDSIKTKEDGDLKDFKTSFDEVKTDLNNLEVNENFTKILNSLKKLEENCNGYSANLDTYKTATQKYNTAIFSIIPAVETFTNYKDYYSYLVNDVKIDAKVEEQYNVRQELSKFLTAVDKVTTKSPLLINGETIKQNTNEILNNVNEAYEHAEAAHKGVAEHHDTHCESIPIANLLLIIFMIIYFIIVAVYWVFEVFRNRAKCRQLNYDNLIKALK